VGNGSFPIFDEQAYGNLINIIRNKFWTSLWKSQCFLIDTVEREQHLVAFQLTHDVQECIGNSAAVKINIQQLVSINLGLIV
jgi:hypothetical protein